MKVLMIVEQCNPDWPSVPLVAYNFYHEISQLVDVTLVTHERNRESLEKLHPGNKIIYMPESNLTKKYYRLVESLVAKQRYIWPLYHTLAYPIYAEFNNNVYKNLKAEILRGDYDIVHALTPMMPRYPYKIVKVCKDTPFILGPVNGGVPFPPGFQETAKKEDANFNFLRAIGRALIPGYAETYKKAHKILAGSTYTLQMLKGFFAIPDNKISLFYENGITQEFFAEPKQPKKEGPIELLFAGRLVPYKCADVVIEALGKLDRELQNKLRLTIVGDGPEKANLEARVRELELENKVFFAGWVKQEQTKEFYRKADIFCFPSIREFGGAVVMEAMAGGLPCIVADYGGIGEYVTPETGFKIEPVSREFLMQEVSEKIKLLVEDEPLRSNMSAKAIERAKEFEWSYKAAEIVKIYEDVV